MSLPLRWHAWFLDCTVKPISCRLWLAPVGIPSLFQASRRTWHVWTQFSCFSLSRQSRHLTTIGCVFTVSFRMLWTDPYEIPNMLTASWIVILLFLRTSSCVWFKFSFVFCQWTCQVFNIFIGDHIISDLGKLIRSVSSLHCLLSNI